MKTLPLNCLLAGLCALGSLHAQSAPRNAIAFWKTGVATENAREIRVPDRAGDHDAVAPAHVGVAIVEDKGVEGGKAVEFSGSQSMDIKNTLRAEKTIEIKDEIYAEIDAKPEMTTHAQAMIYVYGVLEFRAWPQRGNVEMIVWYPGAESKIATSINAPMTFGRWSKISGSIVGSKVELTVNGRTVRGKLPDDATLLPIKAAVVFGAGAQRPMVGRIANMAVCSKKP